MTEKRKTSAGSEDEYRDFHPESYFPTEEFPKMEEYLPLSQSPSENAEQDASVSNEVSTKRISNKQRRLSLEEYRTAFLQVPRIEDRKPVFISRNVRDKLDRIVRTLGTRRMSVSGLLENLATHHLEIYRDDLEQWRKL
ncbi:DUF3408 domain-containing protein [Odoribacter lunatus]|uniref:DUF3408 domain-containing protein n=1 Tax=Odoribacter lunatus TaxID=2941335 RepID=UPI0020419751|nr:DUF3408 domain-containing protein [Odoribacter lunatus]